MRFNAAASPFLEGAPLRTTSAFLMGDQQADRTARRWEPRDSRPHIDFQERQIAGSERSDRFDGAAARAVGNPQSDELYIYM